MPCYDPREREEREDNEKASAILCGFVTALNKAGALDGFLETVDWVEVGLTQGDFQKWWADHQEKDAEIRRWKANSVTAPPMD